MEQLVTTKKGMDCCRLRISSPQGLGTFRIQLEAGGDSRGLPLMTALWFFVCPQVHGCT